MGQYDPLRQTMKLSEVRQQFSPLVNAVFRGETRVIVEKNGLAVAALVPISDLKHMDELEAERKRDFAVVDELREMFRGLSEEEFEREMAKTLSLARKRRRAAQHKGKTK
jgi:prevent-host-death family protein